MHRKRRKNNLVWLFALLGILVLFLGTILAFLIFSNLSSKPTETVQEVSAVNGTGIVLPSHFTERKITDPSTARDAINDVADTLGIVSVEDELGTADCSTVLGDTYYSFPQVYRGIPVYGRKVTVSADADSEAALLTSGFYPIENLSVEAKITQNDAEKIVAGLYPGEADIYVNNLVIFSLDKTNPELAWKISVHQNNSWESVFLSAVDGRALKTFSNELTDNESSSNRFTNVYLYNAENRDIEVDFRIIFDDGTTAIYDGDDDDEWVSLNNQKYTTSGSWRQVVLTAQNGERYKKIGKGGISISTEALGGMPATELLPIDIASLTDGMGTPIVALAKLLAVSNFYRDVLGYDAFGDDNKAVAIVANDHRGGKDSNNASAGYGRSKIFTRISVGATCSPTIDTLGHEVTHAVEQSISRIEHYAMFYEKFQDGTWNDADGIIDAGCAYICEWDDPTDKISQGDSFTDQQLRIIAKDLGVPDDLNVEIRQSPKAYWEAAGLWDIYVEITHNGKLVASGSFDVETGEMGRNIYIYTPV